MAYCKSVVMNLRAARPYVANKARAARCLIATPRVHQRALHVRCQAHDAQEPQKQTDIQRRQEREGALTRPSDFFAPELSIRRMSDYIDSMQREMEAMFDLVGAPSLFRQSPLTSGLSSVFDTPALTTALRSTAFDIQEDEKEYRIMADVPGFSKDNIKVSISNDGVLHVEGNMSEESGDEKTGRSRRMQNFVRRFRLPNHVSPDGVGAKVENGVLSITLPKTGEAEAPAREIPIN